MVSWRRPPGRPHNVPLSELQEDANALPYKSSNMITKLVLYYTSFVIILVTLTFYFGHKKSVKFHHSFNRIKYIVQLTSHYDVLVHFCHLMQAQCQREIRTLTIPKCSSLLFTGEIQQQEIVLTIRVMFYWQRSAADKSAIDGVIIPDS